MKTLYTILITLFMFLTPVSPQTTSHRYFQSFDNGGIDGYSVFTRDVDMNMLNGQLVLTSSSSDYINILLPLGATQEDFSFRIVSSASGNVVNGGIARMGFKSQIGLVSIDDSIRVMYTADIQSYTEPNITFLFAAPMPAAMSSMKLTGIRSGTDLILHAFINDQQIYQGTITNADPSLFSGQWIVGVRGDGSPYTVTIDEIDIRYNPYIQTPGLFSEDFSDPIVPWMRFGDFSVLAQSLDIANGKLNFTYNGTNQVSLLATTPIGAVRDFTFEAEGTGTMGSGGIGGVSRGADLKHYITVFWEDDSVYIGYADGFDEPVMVASASSNIPGTRSKIGIETSGSNQIAKLWMDNVLVLTGTIANPSQRLKSGHIVVSYESTNQINISIDNVVATYTSTFTGTDESAPSLPGSFQLMQNYPNPFNPYTTLTFVLGTSGTAELILYDMLGKKISTLISGYQEAGTCTIEFDAAKFNLPSGVYYAQLKAGGFTQSVKLLLMK